MPKNGFGNQGSQPLLLHIAVYLVQHQLHDVVLLLNPRLVPQLVDVFQVDAGFGQLFFWDNQHLQRGLELVAIALVLLLVDDQVVVHPGQAGQPAFDSLPLFDDQLALAAGRDLVLNFLLPVFGQLEGGKDATQLLHENLCPDAVVASQVAGQFARYQSGRRNNAESDGGREHCHDNGLRTADGGVSGQCVL